MQTDLSGRDLIGDLDFSKEEVETVIEVALDLKRKRALGEPHAYLRDKVLAMLFFFSSTRTRGSFEAGMAQLGGHAAFIESRTTQISHGDTEKEMGEIFGRYFDGIAIRHVDWGIGNRYLNLVAEASRVPVLNMQCEFYHPHQILADLLTIITGFRFVVDHKIPLAKGGQHRPDNLTPLKDAHNTQKRDRLDWTPPEPVFNRVTYFRGENDE